jgi:glucose-6-phosphate isomerase
VLINQSILCPAESTKLNFDFVEDLLGLDCFSIVKSTEDLDILQHPRLKKWMRHENFVIFGAGGSSLGGQCILQALSQNKNIRFVNNLDVSTLKKVISEINSKNFGFLCISKSGETLETICQTLLALDVVEQKEDKFVILSESKHSSLMEIANEFNFLCLDHPATIDGRFSVFSLVGMLPALLCGIDPLEIRAGGRKTLENHIHEVEKGASFIVEGTQKGIVQHVSFIYSDKLTAFGAWLAQLYAESTGKLGTGITPITAVGSIDQHSQLQLYLDGKKDKCFTFFFEKQDDDLKISENSYYPASFLYLKNKNMADIFRAQFHATMTTIGENDCRVRKMEFSKITPEILGALFMHFMLEVTFACKLIGINPFDQPAVERGKILTKNLLEENSCG